MKYRLCLTEHNFVDDALRLRSRTIHVVNYDYEVESIEQFNKLPDCSTYDGRTFVCWLSDWIEVDPKELPQ
jgi:hypothetical protein